jgi:hypothetical protein
VTTNRTLTCVTLSVVVACAIALSAATPISIDRLVYRGAYRLPAAKNIGKGAALAYAPSRGTWFVLDSRLFDFDLLEIHMPDDRDYPGGAQNPTMSQASAPAATLVQDWGPRLSTAVGGPIDPAQNDVFGAYWDDQTSRLYVSYADFYGDPTTNDCLVAIDFSVASPKIYGPWRFGHGTTEFSQRWGFSQFVRAPKSLTEQAASGLRFLATGHDNNTFQQGSWGPGLMLVGEPSTTTAPRSMLDAQQVMFWPAVKATVTLDTGKVKNALLSSNMLRRDPMIVISGPATNYLGGGPEWSDVPYGRGTLANGWANGDDAGHFVAIDEGDVKGLVYFGTYTVGAQWYGNPQELADDQTVDSTSPTGFKSWGGIDSPKSRYRLKSQVFPADANNPKGYVYDHQGGGKGNRQECIVPAAWFYSFDNVIAAMKGTYRPRAGLTGVNVDPSSFTVLATPFTSPDLHPAFRNLQYDDGLNPYTASLPSHIIKVKGAYFRPTGVAGVARRIYVRMSSNLASGNDVVNVFDLQ